MAAIMLDAFIPPRRALRAPLCLIAILGAFSSGPAHAQSPGDSIPSTFYFRSMGLYFDGQYSDALLAFREASAGGIKTPAGQWIDSIGAYAMAGEAAYQLGRPQEALSNYDAALKLFVAYSDWMMRVQFPPAIGAAAAAPQPTPWGQSRRRARPGSFPPTFLMGQGQVDNSEAVMRGGIIRPAIMFPVNVVEVVRATTLAIRRRRELLGPVAKFDSLTNDVLDVLSRHPGPPNHWSEAWIDVQLGCAEAAAGLTAQAVKTLQESLLLAGEFDHPLTSVALVELGRLALESGDFPAAGTLFEEASYAAFQFPDLGVLEESLRYGLVAHLLSNQKGPYPPLAPAIAWAKSQGYRVLNASLLLSAAENLLTQSETAEANAYLNSARTLVGRSDLANSHLGARLNHLSAAVAYQSGNVPSGDQSLALALEFQQGGSLWLFQIAQADSYYRGGNLLSDRNILGLFELLLRDPTATDWANSPLECLSVLCSPHEIAYEHWFETAIKNPREHELALEIADRVRRHRFFTSLPLGGRLLALRWTLEGPPELIGERGLLERQDLLSRYPEYGQLSTEAVNLQTKLAAKPAVAEGDARKEQGALLTALAEISERQEVILRQIAVRREPAAMAFPPLRKTKEIQQSLTDGQVLLAFFATSRQMHAFLYSPTKYATWRIGSPANLQRQVGQLLRDMGNFDTNHELSHADLQKSAWRTAASRLMTSLLDKSNVDLAGNFQEIVIVPDSFLWYLPFEAMPIGKPDKQQPLLWHARVRYAPTAGLAVPFSQVRKPRPTVGVVVGKLFPQDDEAVGAEAFEQLSKAVGGAVALPRTLPAPSSIYGGLFDQLIVLDDIGPSEGPYDWSPANTDRGKGGGSLAGWLNLPWGAPTEVILPGYHTSAENGLRRGADADDDLFLSLCGLMASGVRTVLISRWRTGGQTSVELVREFAQELPHVSPAEAWQRSVHLATSMPVEPAREPRINKKSLDAVDPPDANHPLLWAGYMLVDPGTPGPDEDRTLRLPGLNRAPAANPTLVPGAARPANPRPEPPAPEEEPPAKAKAKAKAKGK